MIYEYLENLENFIENNRIENISQINEYIEKNELSKKYRRLLNIQIFKEYFEKFIIIHNMNFYDSSNQFSIKKILYDDLRFLIESEYNDNIYKIFNLD
jgi:hypothetical protein